jgi:hypothetical protein
MNFESQFVQEIHPAWRELSTFGLENDKAADRKRLGESDT